MSQLVKKLEQLPKSSFSIEDVSKVSDLPRPSLRVALHRLVKKGELLALSKGLYQLPNRPIDAEALACELGYPAYLSLEWALAQHAGVLHQLPRSIELMTTGRTRELEMAGQLIRFHHLKNDLFWGYRLEENILVAEPEKAIIDLLYLERVGLKKLQTDEIRWEALDLKKLMRYAKRTKKIYLIEKVRTLTTARS